MNERERLIELVSEYKENNNGGGSNIGLTDYLLEKGFVALPCGMDNVRKLNVYYKHHIKNKYAIVQYDCQRGKPHKIVSYDIQGKELLQNEDIKLYDYLPSTNFTVILDGFDTKQEAEQALKGVRSDAVCKKDK